MCLIQVSTGKRWGVIGQVLLLPNRMSWIHIIGGLITPNMFVITECFCNEISCVQVWQLKDKSKYPILVAKPGRHTAKIFFFYVKVVSIAKWNSGMKSDTEFETSLWSNYLPYHPRCPHRISIIHIICGTSFPPNIFLSDSFPVFHLTTTFSPCPWQQNIHEPYKKIFLSEVQRAMIGENVTF